MAFLPAVQAWSQGAYPERPIKIIVGFSPGGSVDGSARIAAQILTDKLGKPVVVDNQVGASGAIAAANALKAPPDGYTLFVSAPANVINPIVNKQVGHNLETDFVPIALIADVANVLVVHSSVPVSSVQELVAYGKKQPGVLSYGSAGVGSASHLAGALFEALAGLEMVHVPYKGTAAAQTDLLSGRIPLMFDSMVSAMPSAKAGKVKALAVTSDTRWPSMPELPTMAESGFAGYSVTTWIGLHAPLGTPPQVVAKLSEALLSGLRTPEMRARLAVLGAEPGQYSPAEFNRFLSNDVERWRKYIDGGVIKLN